jgi:SAM-dependent methyltransferase
MNNTKYKGIYMYKDTINYYDKNAIDFFGSTVSVDFSSNQNKFLSYLEPNMMILDLGCGSGRDTKYFIDKGLRVEAIDGSEELCKLASEFTGIQVKNMMFDQIEDIDKYDGVWACSSILHLPYEELKKVFYKISNALKNKGVFYTSFKYGDFEGIRNGRYFTDMTQEKMNKLLEETNVFVTEQCWITSDVRPGRDEEKWLNIIMRKK